MSIDLEGVNWRGGGDGWGGVCGGWWWMEGARRVDDEAAGGAEAVGEREPRGDDEVVAQPVDHRASGDDLGADRGAVT